MEKERFATLERLREKVEQMDRDELHLFDCCLERLLTAAPSKTAEGRHGHE